MQRTALIALVTAVVAASIAATATIVLTGGDDERTVTLPTVSPGMSPETTVDVASPEASPRTADRTPAQARSGRGGSVTEAPSVTATPPVEIRRAGSVDCEEEAHFCSTTDEMVVEGSSDNLELKTFEEASDAKSTKRPTITMTSRALDPDRETMGPGEEVAFLDVQVVVSNEASDTFVFDRREIVLEIIRNGKPYDDFATKGEGFEMTPGSKMTGDFERPITQPGEYSWRAKIWYYRK